MGSIARRLATFLAVLTACALFSAAVSEGILRTLTREEDLLSIDDQAYWQARVRKARQSPSVDAREPDTEYDAQLGWRMRRLYRGNGITNDAKGFRAAGPQRGGGRALFIGDSFTYGLGVPDKLTFAAQFGALTGRTALNAGVTGYGADQAVLMWELEGRALAPQVVVLGYVLDDFFRNALWLRDAPKPYFAFDPAANDWQLSGVPVPHLADLPDERLGASGFRLLDASRLVARRARAKLGIADETLAEEARLSDYILARLRDSVAASGARLVVLVIGRTSNPIDDRVEASIRESCTRLGVPCIDLAQEMRAGDLDAYFGGNGHYSPLGHRFAAQRLADSLR